MATTIKTFDFVRGQVQVTRMSMGSEHGVGYQIDQDGPGCLGYLVCTTKEVLELAAFLVGLDAPQATAAEPDEETEDPSGHPFEAAPGFSDVCDRCGESESAHEEAK